MCSRRFRRLRYRGPFVASFVAATPLPALAADPALSAWGAYLFFAIVATVVIVLLLHEALEDDSSYDQRRENRVGEKPGSAPGSRFTPHEASRDAKNRRVA